MCFRCVIDPTTAEDFTDKHQQAELLPPAYAADPSPAQPKRKLLPFSHIHKPLAAHFSNHHDTGFNASEEHLETSCSTSLSPVHCATLQDKLDLEMSVLRRQEAVLKLQEEYYTLKINLMKKKMAEGPLMEKTK